MKNITITKEFTVHMNPNGAIEVTFNVENILKTIGAEYGLFSWAEDAREAHVVLAGSPETPALELQVNISSIGWDTAAILSTDKNQIDAYMKYRDILNYIKHWRAENEKNCI